MHSSPSVWSCTASCAAGCALHAVGCLPAHIIPPLCAQQGPPVNKTGLKGSKAACLEVWELLRPHLDSVAGNAVRAVAEGSLIWLSSAQTGEVDSMYIQRVLVLFRLCCPAQCHCQSDTIPCKQTSSCDEESCCIDARIRGGPTLMLRSAGAAGQDVWLVGRADAAISHAAARPFRRQRHRQVRAAIDPLHYSILTYQRHATVSHLLPSVYDTVACHEPCRTAFQA